tara:strand:- start:13 stop:774 length:762 start_codon:yes stop_codon:yes gene_type:complete
MNDTPDWVDELIGEFKPWTTEQTYQFLMQQKDRQNDVWKMLFSIFGQNTDVVYQGLSIAIERMLDDNPDAKARVEETLKPDDTGYEINDYREKAEFDESTLESMEYGTKMLRRREPIISKIYHIEYIKTLHCFAVSFLDNEEYEQALPRELVEKMKYAQRNHDGVGLELQVGVLLEEHFPDIHSAISQLLFEESDRSSRGFSSYSLHIGSIIKSGIVRPDWARNIYKREPFTSFMQRIHRGYEEGKKLESKDI